MNIALQAWAATLMRLIPWKAKILDNVDYLIEYSSQIKKGITVAIGHLAIMVAHEPGPFIPA